MVPKWGPLLPSRFSLALSLSDSGTCLGSFAFQLGESRQQGVLLIEEFSSAGKVAAGKSRLLGLD